MNVKINIESEKLISLNVKRKKRLVKYLIK